jgi:hypothetical protein
MMRWQHHPWVKRVAWVVILSAQRSNFLLPEELWRYIFALTPAFACALCGQVTITDAMEDENWNDLQRVCPHCPCHAQLRWTPSDPSLAYHGPATARQLFCADCQIPCRVEGIYSPTVYLSTTGEEPTYDSHSGEMWRGNRIVLGEEWWKWKDGWNKSAELILGRHKIRISCKNNDVVWRIYALPANIPEFFARYNPPCLVLDNGGQEFSSYLVSGELATFARHCPVPFQVCLSLWDMHDERYCSRLQELNIPIREYDCCLQSTFNFHDDKYVWDPYMRVNDYVIEIRQSGLRNIELRCCSCGVIMGR